MACRLKIAITLVKNDKTGNVNCTAGRLKGRP